MHFDFVEIGTSNFDHLAGEMTGDQRGISVEPYSPFFEQLPKNERLCRFNCAISDTPGAIDLYFIHPDDCNKYEFPEWMIGCMKLGVPHPLALKVLQERDLPQNLIQKIQVPVSTLEKILDESEATSIDFLKIDTEGHDIIILQSAIELWKRRPILKPQKIMFESNYLSDRRKLADLVYNLRQLGYEITKTGHDTIMELTERDGASNPTTNITDPSLGEVSKTTIKIPRIFHFIWFGPNPLPEDSKRYIESWKQHHPNWEVRMWNEQNLFTLTNKREFDQATKLAQKADIARYEVLYRHGGVYLDTDFECLKNIEPLLNNLDGFAAREDDQFINIAIIGAVPGHPLLQKIIQTLPESFAKSGQVNVTTGPQFFTPLARKRSDFEIFGPEIFYPLHHSGKLWGPLSNAYANHHWACSWAPQLPVSNSPISPKVVKELGLAKISMHVGGQKFDFHYFASDFARKIVGDIFSGECYHLVLRKDVHTIVDVGANVGAFSVFAHFNYPQARILAFEPASSAFRVLEKNTSNIQPITVFNYGLLDEDRTCPLFIGRVDPATNSIFRSSFNAENSEEAEFRNAEMVMKKHDIKQIDILKIDTEGCELQIIQSLQPNLETTRVIYLEYHSEEDRIELDRFLTPTHTLVSTTAKVPHRGELCYLLKSELYLYDQMAIQT